MDGRGRVWGDRPAPHPRADLEVLGGARPGPRQAQVALALLRAASASGTLLSAYADDALLPGEALRRLGWRRVGQFTDWRGPLPTPVAHGSDDTVSHVALDASGQGVGICRAWLDGDTLTIGSPGVQSTRRGATPPCVTPCCAPHATPPANAAPGT